MLRASEVSPSPPIPVRKPLSHSGLRNRVWTIIPRTRNLAACSTPEKHPSRYRGHGFALPFLH
jgi:hypothetical protein